MTASSDNPDPSREESRWPDDYTGVYQPRRGPVAKIVAWAILILLILVPSVIVLVTLDKWVERPRPITVPPPSPGTHSVQPSQRG